MNTLDKYYWFLSSLIPLYFLFSIKYSNININIIIIILFIGAFVLYKIETIKKEGNNFIKITEIKICKTINLKYLIISLLPVVLFNLNNISEIFACILTIFLVYIFYVKYDLFYLNPFLDLIGYKVYECTFEFNKGEIICKNKMIITKLCMEQLKYSEVGTLDFKFLANNLYIVEEVK